MLWDESERKFVPGQTSTGADDPCLQGLTVSPQEVIKRINQAKGKGGRLDLSGIGLVTVPPEVWTLGDLQDLQLSNNRITSIPDDIGNLVELERLGLAGRTPPRFGIDCRQLFFLRTWFSGSSSDNINSRHTSARRVVTKRNKKQHICSRDAPIFT